MTNRQAQIGKFAPNRAERPKFNPNWWQGLPKVHPLAPREPSRQVLRATMRKAMKRAAQ